MLIASSLSFVKNKKRKPEGFLTTKPTYTQQQSDSVMRKHARKNLHNKSCTWCTCAWGSASSSNLQNSSWRFSFRWTLCQSYHRKFRLSSAFFIFFFFRPFLSICTEVCFPFAHSLGYSSHSLCYSPGYSSHSLNYSVFKGQIQKNLNIFSKLFLTTWTDCAILGPLIHPS